MGILQKIRNSSGLIIGVLGVALLAFIMGGALESGGTLSRQLNDKALTVNGQTVTSQEYFDRVSEFEEFQKRLSGQSSLDETATSQIREIVYHQIVKEKILDDQAAKIGLSVSKEELNDLVIGENTSPILYQLPLFLDPQTRAFDKASLINFLSLINKDDKEYSPEERAMAQTYRSMWLFIENQIKYQRLEEKYNAILTSLISVNDVEVEMSKNDDNIMADFVYATQNYNSIPDSLVTVSDKEIQALYQKRNSSYFNDTKTASISYLMKEITPSEEDFAEVEKEAGEAYEKLRYTNNPAMVVSDYSDSPYRNMYVSENYLTEEEKAFVKNAEVNAVYGPVRDGLSYKLCKLVDAISAPDSVMLKMISIKELPQDKTIDQVLDSLQTLIAGGKSFEEIADEQMGVESNGGTIGWVTEFDLYTAGADFVKSVFNSSIGAVSKVNLQSQKVLIKIDEKTKNINKYKIARVNMPVVVGEKTLNNLDNELNQLVSNPEISKKFYELSSESGHFVIPNQTISTRDFNIAQIQGSRQVIHWAFGEKPGAVKKFDLANSRVVARVNKITPSGIAPYEEVKDALKNEILRNKKAEKIIADLKTKSISTLDGYATAMGSSVDSVNFISFNTRNITNIGVEPVLNAYAKYGVKDQLQGPLKGNSGVFVFKISNKIDGTTETSTEDTKNMMQDMNAYRIQYQALESLKERMKVEDNRIVFF